MVFFHIIDLLHVSTFLIFALRLLNLSVSKLVKGIHEVGMSAFLRMVMEDTSHCDESAITRLMVFYFSL